MRQKTIIFLSILILSGGALMTLTLFETGHIGFGSIIESSGTIKVTSLTLNPHTQENAPIIYQGGERVGDLSLTPESIRINTAPGRGVETVTFFNRLRTGALSLGRELGNGALGAAPDMLYAFVGHEALENSGMRSDFWGLIDLQMGEAQGRYQIRSSTVETGPVYTLQGDQISKTSSHTEPYVHQVPSPHST